MVFGRDERVGEFFSILRNRKINKGSGKLQVRICLEGTFELDLEVTNIGKYLYTLTYGFNCFANK